MSFYQKNKLRFERQLHKRDSELPIVQRRIDQKLGYWGNGSWSMKVENNPEETTWVSNAGGLFKENESWERLLELLRTLVMAKNSYPMVCEEECQIGSQKWTGCDWMEAEGIQEHLSSFTVRKEKRSSGKIISPIQYLLNSAVTGWLLRAVDILSQQTVKALATRVLKSSESPSLQGNWKPTY